MAWTVRVKLKSGLYDMPISKQWEEKDARTPEEAAQLVLKALKDQNPEIVVVVKTK